MSELLLSVKGLKKHFPLYSGIFRREIAQVKAVNGVDFDLKEGTALGLVGESGSGKSTIARLVIGLTSTTEGKLFYRGQDFETFGTEDLKKFRKQVQMIFQDPLCSLNPRKTILDAIGEGLEFHGMAHSRQDIRDKVGETLKQVGLKPDMMHRYPHEFSGGQQQRICIGRAIILNPNLIVCDEAVSSLDISVQAQILNLFQDLKEDFNLSYLFIAHDLSVVRMICDYVVVIYLGKVMEQGPKEQIFKNPKHPYTQALLSAVPKEHPDQRVKRIVLKGDLPSSIHPPSGCPFRTRCPYAQDICAKTPPVKKVKNDFGEDQVYHCILD